MYGNKNFILDETVQKSDNTERCEGIWLLKYRRIKKLKKDGEMTKRIVWVTKFLLLKFVK